MLKMIELKDKNNEMNSLRIKVNDDSSVEFQAKAGEWISVVLSKDDALVISAMLQNVGEK